MLWLAFFAYSSMEFGYVPQSDRHFFIWFAVDFRIHMIHTQNIVGVSSHSYKCGVQCNKQHFLPHISHQNQSISLLCTHTHTRRNSCVRDKRSPMCAANNAALVVDVTLAVEWKKKMKWTSDRSRDGKVKEIWAGMRGEEGSQREMCNNFGAIYLSFYLSYPFKSRYS